MSGFILLTRINTFIVCYSGGIAIFITISFLLSNNIFVKDGSINEDGFIQPYVELVDGYSSRDLFSSALNGIN